MSEPAALYRTPDGKVCHRDGCRFLTEKSVPWFWTIHLTDEEVAKNAPWVRYCKVCKPIGEFG